MIKLIAVCDNCSREYICPSHTEFYGFKTELENRHWTVIPTTSRTLHYCPACKRVSDLVFEDAEPFRIFS